MVTLSDPSISGCQKEPPQVKPASLHDQRQFAAQIRPSSNLRGGLPLALIARLVTLGKVPTQGQFMLYCPKQSIFSTANFDCVHSLFRRGRRSAATENVK